MTEDHEVRAWNKAIKIILRDGSTARVSYNGRTVCIEKSGSRYFAWFDDDHSIISGGATPHEAFSDLV